MPPRSAQQLYADADPPTRLGAPRQAPPPHFRALRWASAAETIPPRLTRGAGRDYNRGGRLSVNSVEHLAWR